MTSLLPLLETLPKAELHLHIEGTLEPELAFALAARNGVALPFTSVDELRAAYDFDDLQSFLDLYYACMTVLRTEQDFADLGRAYLERANADGVRHAELFFDPQVHAANGVPLSTVMDGLLRALADAEAAWGMSGGLILCFVRDQPVASALATLEEAAPRAGDLLGVGLDSAEVCYPPSLFAEVFERARALGLHRVAHAGEEGPPAYVREAVDLLGVERIDHGIRAAEDAALIDLLVERRIPLTVCPHSNVRLKAVAGMHAHPLRTLFDRGVLVTVNSDDPAYFGGYVASNYEAVHAAGFTLDELVRMAANSIDASFASDPRKAELHAMLETWTAEHVD
ncbi:adenosine deaminase [Microbacterium terrae]|uniref:Adenine deaminase n=1 Tax=Microbacterium terrae TaxID=69369 RepID=A0A0M2HA39_9MICO|nr:adenosine deaminase [Microbacterium terrae]KJL43328.1 Adenine deaminase [Microbacterium terrae]MBP1078467.1 adenosine deaminase [Microbacterium terrae]GLJ97868.1 adenine deaminase [Microbacterium terrae]